MRFLFFLDVWKPKMRLNRKSNECNRFLNKIFPLSTAYERIYSIFSSNLEKNTRMFLNKVDPSYH